MREPNEEEIRIAESIHNKIRMRTSIQTNIDIIARALAKYGDERAATIRGFTKEYLDAEEAEFSLHLQTLPPATEKQKTKAHNRVVLTRDNLYSLLGDS